MLAPLIAQAHETALGVTVRDTQVSSPHTSQKGHRQKVKKQLVLAGMGGKGPQCPGLCLTRGL